MLASTAAPTYFEPEIIHVAADMEGGFVDGGVSSDNNTALQSLMLATLVGHGVQWPMGADKLLLVSLGTGSKTVALNSEQVRKMKAVELGVRGHASLMDDASALNEIILQWMSSSATARQIDSESGDLKHDFPGGSRLLSYLRYDVIFIDPSLKGLLSAEQLESIAEMDRT